MTKKVKTKKTKIRYDTINICLATALIALLVVNLYLLGTMSKQIALGAREPASPNASSLAKLTLTHLMPLDCEGCFDAAQIISAIEKLPNVQIENLQYYADKPEAKALIKQYKITRLPAVIVTGETGKVDLTGLETREGAFVYDTAPPPYYDTASKHVRGLVKATALLSPGCESCTDVIDVLDQLTARGVKLQSTKRINYTSIEGKRLIDAYNITAVPTLLFTEDAMLYDIFSSVWSEVGSVESDGTLVLRRALPPYRDLPSNKLRGLVDLTFIVDSSCADCYNVSLHKQILANNFRVSFGKEETVDVSSARGKMLVEKYGINLVPTVLLSAEANVYAGLISAWNQIGTQNDDGTFLFRKVNLLEGVTYRNLTSGEIESAASSAAAQ